MEPSLQELQDVQCISSRAGVLATVTAVTPKDIGNCPAASVRNLILRSQAIADSCAGEGRSTLAQAKLIEMILLIDEPSKAVKSRKNVGQPVWRHYLPDSSWSWASLTSCPAIMLDSCSTSINGWVSGRIHLSLAAAVADMGLGGQGAPNMNHFISLVSGRGKPAQMPEERRELAKLRDSCSRIAARRAPSSTAASLFGSHQRTAGTGTPARAAVFEEISGSWTC